MAVLKESPKNELQDRIGIVMSKIYRDIFSQSPIETIDDKLKFKKTKELF